MGNFFGTLNTNNNQEVNNQSPTQSVNKYKDDIIVNFIYRFIGIPKPRHNYNKLVET